MEIVNVLYNGTGKSIQNYSDRDLSLINSTYINTTFGDPNDYIEAFISDEAGSILSYDYNLQSYFKTSEVNSGTNKFTSILVDPQKDVADKGFNRGSVTIQYNVLKNLFNSKYGVFYWIKEISPSKLELKLSSQQLSGDTMRSGFGAYQNYISQKNYYSDFYLNFGDNNLILAINAAYVNDDQGSYILVKLYEPLPTDFDIKSQLWIVDKLSEPVSFAVSISIEAEQIDTTEKLRGPNFKIEVAEKIGQSTPYYSYNNLFSAQVSSSVRQLMSYYEDKAVAINTDYTDFNNFIHFSSATERISNFAYKVGLIENYNIQIVSQSAITGNSQVGSIATASINVLQNNIDSIIEKFDNYEYYLYYVSGTYAWPKSGSAKPYNLYSATSSQAINWLGTPTTVPTSTKLSILYSASLYDQTNKDLLSVSIPQYLLDDPNNQPYVTFLDMIGQHFDNIWIYYKDVSNRFNATNDPNTGISLDLVSDALKGLGIELYTNTNLSDTAYYSLFGINDKGTSTYPTGSEKNITIISSSLTSLPYDQIQKEIYKRIYHNLPYLLKTRGTERGVKALIACYGIPDSILTVNEFGGTALGGEDIFELSDTKINIVTPTELSQSVLSPKSTLQQYSSNYRKNSLSVEVGFSPADILNANITSSLVYSIDQLIGNPSLRYSSSYDSLDTYRNNYFSSSYNKPHSIAEYVRLIKFYNNSLFKMIKDFVPARSNISTGIIVKPHVLERNKYARNEPQTSIHNNYSESIDMISITGSAATSYTFDTTKNRNITSSLGYITVTDSFGFEKYTGEYQGTELTATSLYSVGDQTELSQNSMLSSSRINYGAIYQNVTGSVRSQRRLDLDYAYNSRVPVNFGIVTKSIKDSTIDNFATYNNPMNPFAELQDFNYNIQRSTIPRYYGSKTISLKYNTYTTASDSWSGDSSYGSTAAIDRNSFKVGWVKNIPVKALNFPDKTTVYLKYLIDSTQNITDLSLENNNIFEVQNTFKSGDTVNLSVSDVNKPSNQKSLDGTKTIWKGGFSFDPILFRENGEALYFQYLDYYKKYTSYEGFYTENRAYRNFFSQPGVNTSYVNNVNQFDPNQILANDPNGPGISGYYSNYYDRPAVPQRYLDPATDPILSDTAYTYDEWNTFITSNIWFSTRAPKYDNSNPYAASFATTPYPYMRKTWRLPVYMNEFTKPWTQLNDPDDSVNQDPAIFVAPTNATYEIGSGISFEMLITVNASAGTNTTSGQLTNQILSQGTAFKIFGLLEKSTDGGNTWSVISAGNLSAQFYTYTNNTLRINASNLSQWIPVTIKLNNTGTNSVTLQRGDRIKYNIFIVDLLASFRHCSTYSIRFNNGSNSSYLQQIPYSQLTYTDFYGNFVNQNSIIGTPPFNFFGCYNTQDPRYTFDTSAVIDQNANFFGINNNILTINDPLLSLFVTSSQFLPDTSSAVGTYENYSPVINPLSIQPGDIIRFGSFNSPQIKYATVISSTPPNTTVFTPTTSQFSFNNVPVTFFTNNSYYNSVVPGGGNSSIIRVSNVSSFGYGSLNSWLNQTPTFGSIKVSLSNSLNDNAVLNLKPTKAYYDGTYIYIFISEAVIPETLTQATIILIGGNAVTSTNLTFTLNSYIDATAINVNKDFAILRQKPDETSVIVDFKKVDGEVSQTILVPQDANIAIKSKVGELFRNFNTDLQNTTTTN